MDAGRRVIAGLFAAVFMMFTLSANVYGAEKIDYSKKGSFTASLATPGVEVRLYDVGDIWEDGTLVISPEYEKYSVQLKSLDSGDGAGAALALESYMIRDGVVPVQTAVTGKDGNAHFSGLLPGVYLLSYDCKSAGDSVAVFAPAIISIPTYLDGVWKYDLDAAVKRQIKEDAQYCTVMKVWTMADEKSVHPEDVTVQLLKDGRVYDEQILNAANSWRYAWHDLEAGLSWRVVEKDVPDGYVMELNSDGTVFVIDNIQEEPGKEDVPEVPDKEEDKKLPQTGQLWWPVPALIAAGLLFMTVGVYLRRTDME